jgi:DNA-binding IscR family transcriptional regulator
MGFKKCPFNYGCFMHPVWIKIRSEILDLLRKTSLDDLLTGEKSAQQTKINIT